MIRKWNVKMNHSSGITFLEWNWWVRNVNNVTFGRRRKKQGSQLEWQQQNGTHTLSLNVYNYKPALTENSTVFEQHLLKYKKRRREMQRRDFWELFLATTQMNRIMLQNRFAEWIGQSNASPSCILQPRERAGEVVWRMRSAAVGISSGTWR